MTHTYFPFAKHTVFLSLVVVLSVLARANAQTAPVTGQVVCHGDSLTWGANASSGIGSATGPIYPGVLAEKLGPAWRVTNLGTGGWTISMMTNEASQKVDPLFNPSLKQNVLIIFGGTNDLGGWHQTADTTYQRLVAYCNARKAAHPWKILVITPPMAAYPKVYPDDFDQKMVQYDDLIRKNWRTFADGIIDVQADPRFGVPGAEHNPVYFSAKDFTHLTDTGYKIVGTDAYKAVKKLTTKRHRFLGIF
jgi:lysophospholipase L1-like esterase